jgi:Ca2+/H+ antiporter, TMEM165/GDT1 family
MTNGWKNDDAPLSLPPRGSRRRRPWPGNMLVHEENFVRFRGRWVAKGAAFLVLAFALLALLSFVVMGLWNALIPGLFRGPVLSFWQAAGLLVLSKILFGGLRRGHGWHGHRWRREMWLRKWESMTPEERERLRTRFRCGPWDVPGDSRSPDQQTKP